MEVHLSPDLERQLNDVAAKTGRAADELAQDVIAGYLGELAGVRRMLDSRYDDLKSGRVKPIDGEAFFENLRQREEDLLKRSQQ
jgi:hypothetical protein